jgi:hypothetical protein
MKLAEFRKLAYEVLGEERSRDRRYAFGRMRNALFRRGFWVVRSALSTRRAATAPAAHGTHGRSQALSRHVNA